MLRHLAPLALVLALCATLAAADDTAKIQALLDRPNASGIVTLPPGTFTVRGLKLNPTRVKYLMGTHSIGAVGGQQVVKYGTTLLLAPNQGDGVRILTVSHSSNTDSPLVTITGIKFDMNRANQVWNGTSFALEHQGGIFLVADKTKTGKLKVKIVNVQCNNSAGDGIYVFHGTHVSIAGYTATDIFRCALGITGKNSITDARNCVFVRGGVDVEPNNPGDSLTVNLADIKTQKWDIALVDNCQFTATRITHTYDRIPCYLYCPPAATCSMSSSTFQGNYKVRIPGDAAWTNCTFTGLNAGQPVISFQWARTGYDYTGMVPTFTGCTIKGPGSCGIHTSTDDPTKENGLTLINTAIVGTTVGVTGDKTSSGRIKKGDWTFTNSTFNGSALTVP